MLKKILANYYYNNIHTSALGYRLRNLLQFQPIAELKPFNERAAVSDLFVWRCDEEWDTDFELFNIASFLFPDQSVSEKCTFLFFDRDGVLQSQHTQELKPFERKTLTISDYIDSKHVSYGTFSVFHHSDVAQEFAKKQSHITERGYIGYYRKTDKIKSYCHGNLQSLAQGPNESSYGYVAAVQKESYFYPQLILSDCDRIDLVYTNPTSKQRNISINLYNKKREIIEVKKECVPARGVSFVSLDNRDRNIHTFDNIGSISMWRPILFKYYQTHYDVMHG